MNDNAKTKYWFKKLLELQIKHNVQLSQCYTMNSNPIDMQYEYELHQQILEKNNIENKIKNYKKIAEFAFKSALIKPNIDPLLRLEIVLASLIYNKMLLDYEKNKDEYSYNYNYNNNSSQNNTSFEP
jgi:hypothetical protein